MLVMVNFWTQRVPCGTSPKLWVMTGGGTCSRLVAMSGRKNLLAQGAAGAGGAGCAGPAGGFATAPTVRLSPRPAANQYAYLIRCLLRCWRTRRSPTGGPAFHIVHRPTSGKRLAKKNAPGRPARGVRGASITASFTVTATTSRTTAI